MKRNKLGRFNTYYTEKEKRALAIAFLTMVGLVLIGVYIGRLSCR